MYKDKNELYKDIALEVTIDAKKGARNQEIETHATFYSYDVQSGLIKINVKKDNKPLPLPNGTQILLSVVKLDLPQQKMVFTGDIVDSTEGSVYWVIPDELQGYKGAIRTGVFVKLPNDQRLHGGYFKFNMGISEIDENLVPFEENYWQGWNDFQKEAEQEWNAWKASRDKTWREHEEAYYEWKKQQENKQTNYENDTDERWNNWRNQQEKSQSDFESNFAFWKSEQEEEQTGFESDFADWKNTQETKQTNFEYETSQKITDINQTLETTDSQVQETNDALESLDAYTKVETDNKLENLDVYSKQETDNKLEEKADKTALNKKAEIGEHGFLTPEKGFENYNNSESESDNQGKLQYVKVGSLCHIFGTVRNLSTIKSSGEIVVATMPSHLSIKTMDRTVCQGSSNDTFTCNAYGSAQPFPNQITITRTRDGSGNSIDFTSDKWLNISLTIRV